MIQKHSDCCYGTIMVASANHTPCLGRLESLITAMCSVQGSAVTPTASLLLTGNRGGLVRLLLGLAQMVAVIGRQADLPHISILLSRLCTDDVALGLRMNTLFITAPGPESHSDLYPAGYILPH